MKKVLNIISFILISINVLWCLPKTAPPEIFEKADEYLKKEPVKVINAMLGHEFDFPKDGKVSYYLALAYYNDKQLFDKFKDNIINEFQLNNKLNTSLKLEDYINQMVAFSEKIEITKQ